MIRALIIDDEPIIRSDTEALLAAHPDIIVVGACGTVAEGKVLIKATKPDLLLLDIHLSDGLSFDILDAFPDFKCCVIFITAYDEHALRAIRIGALDYLLKPVDEDELAKALERVRTHHNNIINPQVQLARREIAGVRDRIALRSQQYVDIVAFDEIVYCQGEGVYTTFYLADGRKILMTHPLKDYEDLLPQTLFLRTHQSFIVNKKCVARYDKEGLLHLRNGTEVPVATRRRDTVLAELTGNHS